MAGYELLGIFARGGVQFLFFVAVQNEVIAHAAADEALLDAWKRINGMIDVKQLCQAFCS